MRHLILSLILVLANTAIAQQGAPPVAVGAAMSRGALECSTAKANLKVGGIVLDDNAPGISFSYINGATFTHKFIGKTTAANGQITIHGHLVFLSNLPKAKSWFALSEEIQDKEYFQAFKFAPVYKADGSIVPDKQGRINIRCTNLRETAEFLPELTEAHVNQLKSANTQN
ncbi:MAG: hypothetical protein V4654_08620 [Bdellovibrionota bacterium]